MSEARERDLVLNPNEYAYVLDKTKGMVNCMVGPYKASLSTTDALVVFSEVTKRFEEVDNQREAVKLFCSAPENWYIVLKNPTPDMKTPIPKTINDLPTLDIGKKVNITGNVSFALYPGQMAKVIQGHRLHLNQYLLARVYDANALNDAEIAEGEIPNVAPIPTDTDGSADTEKPNEEKSAEVKKPSYTTGQMLVIKGSDVPFYIPPTGIEVIPIGGTGEDYVRDAVTLERLEYCILKNEEGNKKYVHGAAVVFPEPDETFVKNPKDGGFKFKAIELSEISGIYLKVIQDYTEKGKSYKAGDELFITGKDQMIYYPRPEHAIIDYEGRILHHAIAIPKGEGRYILNRITGDIKMVKGPSMYLPDPRTEVVVQRKLTQKQCEMWYPGNNEVLKYNTGIEPATLDQMSLRGVSFSVDDVFGGNVNYAHKKSVVTEENSGFSRGNEYSKPRTITIDNRFEGVVRVDIWTGYAINVIPRDGERKVVVGPKSYLMEYDETLEILELSTGKPKTTDNLLSTVYLRVENNKISDIINIQTADFVDVSVKVSYCVDFLKEYKDRWFSVENYVKYMCDRQRSLMKREAKNHTIEDFISNSTDIIRNVALDIKQIEIGVQEDSGGNFEPALATVEGQRVGRLFEENGMFVHDVEVLSVTINDEKIKALLNENQEGIVKKSLKLTNADKDFELEKKLTEIRDATKELEHKSAMYAEALQLKERQTYIANQDTVSTLEEEADKKRNEAKLASQKVLDDISKAELAREDAVQAQLIAIQGKKNNLISDMRKKYTDDIKKVIESIGPELTAALTSSANAEIIEGVAKAMSPYAIANGESVSDTVNTLLRGTTLENLFDRIQMYVSSSEDDY